MDGIIFDDFVEFFGDFEETPEVEIALFLDIFESIIIHSKHGEFMRSDSF